MTRLIPHPGLSAFLVLFWLILANAWTLGSLVMALIIGLVIPLITSAWWPERPRIRRPFALVAYLGIVIWDVIVSSFQVAKIVLFMPKDRIRSAFVVVPVDLTSPEAISLLAGTITMTPGTLTADFSEDRRCLLIHSLHAPDPDEVRDSIKSRYEARLKRIFE
ncbi:Na+/H+ antiporter subunit E [Xinfangfangia pollutisoli]|uniref:Na+/H+ antiporter subunit E n=1 Tax=Xinfangfangia pollutisoli TaxID=2865960 RepID=UPI001CD6D7AB|nr:Na+/H+ antiporter subunit E [Xinfangfangia pollutisoli]